MTKKEAKRLSILKWELIIANNGRSFRVNFPKEILALYHLCGYCEKYTCPKCPIMNSLPHGCVNIKHPWNIWWNDPTVKNAQAVLDLIRKS